MQHVCRGVAVDVEPARRGDQHELGGLPGAKAVAGGGESEQPMSRREAAKVGCPGTPGSQHLRPGGAVQEVHERRGRGADGAGRGDRGRQHAVHDGQIGVQLGECVSGVEGDLRAGRGCHHQLRLRFEGDMGVRIRATAVVRHAQAETNRRVACFARAEDRHLMTAVVEQGRRRQQRREVAARTPSHHEHAHAPKPTRQLRSAISSAIDRLRSPASAAARSPQTREARLAAAMCESRSPPDANLPPIKSYASERPEQRGPAQRRLPDHPGEVDVCSSSA